MREISKRTVRYKPKFRIEEKKELTTTMISNFVYKELTTTRKLNCYGSKFSIWKSKMDFVMFDIGVSYVLTDPRPPNPTSETPREERDKYQKWVSDDFTCRHAIFSSMEDNLIIFFDRYETAKEIMDALNNLFASNSFGRGVIMVGNLNNHKMSEETHVMDHVFEMCAMVTELEKIGTKIPEMMQVFILMRSLADSWQPAMDLFKKKDDKELTIDNLIRFISIENEIRASDDHEEDESSKKKKKQRTGGGGGGVKGVCYACGTQGHYAKECPNCN